MIDNNATAANFAASNLATMFFQRVNHSPNKEAFRYLKGQKWQSVTWRNTAAQVQDLAAGLLALGVEPEQRLAIVSSTRYEWVLADLAIMCAGGATTTVYPSTHARDTAYILRDSASRVVFAEDASQLAKLTAHRPHLPDLTTVVVFDGEADGDRVITLAELAKKGAKYLCEHPGCVQETADAVTDDQLATLIYTSGTTGQPKGVRLAHRAWVSQARFFYDDGILGEDDVQLLWLPLAHSFGKALLNSQLACGFVSAIDARVDKIVENMAVVKPTFVAAVPRIFEKVYARVVTSQRAQGAAQAELFDQAFQVAIEVERRQRVGHTVPLPMRRQHERLDELVFSGVRDLFGGRVRFFFSGSAPLNRDIAEWFHAAGLLILEGYGLTESAGAGFVNRPENYKLGTVGPPFDGMSVRVSEEGEVQLRGPLMMSGYHHLPEKTAEAMTGDGWLRTGDKGSLDEDGFLAITGRIKEMFKTSGGKYVVPPVIEARFMALCPYASQFLVFGEARQFCVALITLDVDATRSWAAERGLADASYAELVASPEVRRMIEEHVGRLNAELNRWETIKKWELLDHELSVENGELTPSLKVKRSVVAEFHKELLDAFYA